LLPLHLPVVAFVALSLANDADESFEPPLNSGGAEPSVKPTAVTSGVKPTAVTSGGAEPSGKPTAVTSGGAEPSVKPTAVTSGGAEPSGKWAGVLSNLWNVISNSKRVVAATVLEQTLGNQGAVCPAPHSNHSNHSKSAGFDRKGAFATCQPGDESISSDGRYAPRSPKPSFAAGARPLEGGHGVALEGGSMGVGASMAAVHGGWEGLRTHCA
jgi:hypothetical protein